MLDSEKPVDPQDEKKLKTRGIGSGEDYEPFIKVHEIRGSRDFPSKNDKVLWRPRRPWPPEGYYFSLTGKYPSIERISSSRSGNFSLNSKW